MKVHHLEELLEAEIRINKFKSKVNNKIHKMD